MNKEQKDAYYKKVQELELKFESERDEIGKFIHDNIISKLTDIKEVAELQVHTSSQRHRLSDKISNLRSKIRKHSERIGEERKHMYFKYKTEYNVRLNDSEIHKHIDADLEPKTNFKIVLENQIDYYRRTIETIDKIGFAVKYLIESTRFLNGGY